MQIRTHVLFEGMTLTKRTITEYPLFTLKIGRIYKGSVPDHIRVATGIGTADGTAAPDCSFPFEIGREYLVYAWEGKGEYGGLLATSVCSGTNLIGQAGRHLRYLQGNPPTLEDKLSEEGDFKGLSKLYESRDTAKISGRVFGSAKNGRPYLDFKLWQFVDGEWQSHFSSPHVRQDGRYDFNYLEPGEYKIGVLQDLGNGSRRVGFYGNSERLEEARIIRIASKEDIAGINIQLKSPSQHIIRGTVQCTNGSVFRGRIRIRVANSWDRNQRIGAEISSCGAFQIPGVYSGKFRVIATLEPESLDPLEAWAIGVSEIRVPEQAKSVVLQLERERLPERATSLNYPMWDIWTGTVSQVLDGDRILLELGDGDIRPLRIANIACPAPGQDGWETAKKFTARELLGKKVTFFILQSESSKTPLKYEDAPDIGIGLPTGDAHTLATELLKAGLAWHYTKYSSDPGLARLEAEARAAGRGIWSKPNPVPPSEYRKTQHHER